MIVIIFSCTFCSKDCFKVVNNNLSDYILIENEKLSDFDYGGFYWWVHQVACAIKLAQKNNKKVLVYFNQGFYKDDTRSEPSWWNYYFKHPTLSQHEIDLINYAKQYGKFEIVKSFDLHEIPDDKMFLYTAGDTFTNVMRDLMTDVHGIYSTFLEFSTDVMDVYYNFCNMHSIDFDNQLFIGLHYRGTDKWYSFNATEDLERNKHMCYSDVATKTRNILKDVQNEYPDRQLYIYACSDEQPFVDYIHSQFDNVYSYHAFRSPISTSDVSMPEDQSMSPTDDTEYGRLLKYYGTQSVHKGFKHISPYKKGMDAVIDVLCLSKCKYFLCCQKGNFASQPAKFNPSIIEIDLSNI